jgi:hypothetical protein
MMIDQEMNEDDESGDKGEKVNPGRFPGEEIPPQFNAREARRLNPPQPPGLLGKLFEQSRD